MAEYSGSAATATEDSEEPQDFDPSEVDQDVHVTESTDKKKRLFTKELRCMMYGFGDDQNPYAETVDLLEDLVLEFITEMTLKATEVGRQGRVQVEDIIFLIRKDPRKYSRIKQLLLMNEELKKARKAFDEANY
ncbi:transcription initiation factor TFIID subunit 13-like [Diadema antillarum]|uniref:transcription initiation factor TFIID subunit 13-like n=1 Tax=Diadema antillarum TaxID=105358 RepID=UPI003A8BAE39